MLRGACAVLRCVALRRACAGLRDGCCVDTVSDEEDLQVCDSSLLSFSCPSSVTHTLLLHHSHSAQPSYDLHCFLPQIFSWFSSHVYMSLTTPHSNCTSTGEPMMNEVVYCTTTCHASPLHAASLSTLSPHPLPWH